MDQPLAPLSSTSKWAPCFQNGGQNLPVEVLERIVTAVARCGSLNDLTSLISCNRSWQATVQDWVAPPEAAILRRLVANAIGCPVRNLKPSITGLANLVGKMTFARLRDFATEAKFAWDCRSRQGMVGGAPFYRINDTVLAWWLGFYSSDHIEIKRLLGSVSRLVNNVDVELVKQIVGDDRPDLYFHLFQSRPMRSALGKALRSNEQKFRSFVNEWLLGKPRLTLDDIQQFEEFGLYSRHFTQGTRSGRVLDEEVAGSGLTKQEGDSWKCAHIVLAGQPDQLAELKSMDLSGQLPDLLYLFAFSEPTGTSLEKLLQMRLIPADEDRILSNLINAGSFDLAETLSDKWNVSLPDHRRLAVAFIHFGDADRLLKLFGRGYPWTLQNKDLDNAVFGALSLGHTKMLDKLLTFCSEKKHIINPQSREPEELVGWPKLMEMNEPNLVKRFFEGSPSSVDRACAIIIGSESVETMAKAFALIPQNKHESFLAAVSEQGRLEEWKFYQSKQRNTSVCGLD